MITNSRYDFMSEGNTYDEISGSTYPDPLTLNYAKFQLDEVPKQEEMNNFKLNYFWRVTHIHYGQSCWDDMILTLNGVPHKNLLKPGDMVYFPTEKSIVDSFKKVR